MKRGGCHAQAAAWLAERDIVLATGVLQGLEWLDASSLHCVITGVRYKMSVRICNRDNVHLGFA